MEPELITSYTDALGTERTSPDWAVRRIRELLASGDRSGPVSEVIRIRAGEPTGPLAERSLDLEDGSKVRLGQVVPPDLPYGYHRLDLGAGEGLVLHAPARVPEPERSWVLAAQLPSVRSAASWGMGDLRDAAQLGRWAAAQGDGLVMLNPLHAAIPGPHPQPSPYFASSRAFREPLLLAVDALPGSAHADPNPSERAALNRTDLLDRPGVWRAKRAGLEARWATAAVDPTVTSRIDRWLADPVNGRYVSYCTAQDDRGVGADPRFHAWLQLCLVDQVAALDGRLVSDVAVGVDRAGADVALWPACFVDEGTRIGCPPDQFNTQGQDWGLPPLHPAALRAAGYEPFIRAIRAAAQGAAGIRIDHVMAFDRTFWIPDGAAPADGVYVQSNLDELLDVVAIEADRAGAFVVGEDLGTVPPSIPPALAERGILSYRVVSLDPQAPAWFDSRTMAAVTTHDLATSRGLLTGTDLVDQSRLGMAPNVADTEAAVERLKGWTGKLDDLDATIGRIHELVAASPSKFAVLTTEDAAGSSLRPNMPGTIDAWPNWNIPLPLPLEEVLDSPRARSLRSAIADREPRDPSRRWT